MHDPKLLVGFSTCDDVGAYLINDDIAIVQNIDLITPVVDDPYSYGQIAAANSLSDLYAKGARPLMAMNVVCFPVHVLGIEPLMSILMGAHDKLLEAEVALGGGHTIEDAEPKYGLAIVGIARPDRMVTNATAQPGDALILTKPIGSGVLISAMRKMNVTGNDLAMGQHDLQEAICSMATLNRVASDVMMELGVNACTDITGFGLLGHLYEMISASGVGAVIHVEDVPILSGARDLARRGICSSANRRNESYVEHHTELLSNLSDEDKVLLYEAETSGGLLMSMAKDRAPEAMSLLRERRVVQAAVIGEVIREPTGKIILE